MAETSRGRFTITLGQTGQVVKRSATVPETNYSDSPPNAGSKRSIKDRLGISFDGSLLHGSQAHNKRQRGDNYLDLKGTQDIHFGKDDLRFKLMQKHVFRRAQSDDHGKSMDLREKLSRTRQPSVRPRGSLDIRHRIPKLEGTFSNSIDIWQQMPEPKDKINGRIPPTRSADDLPLMQSSRNSYSPWTLDHIRQRSPVRTTGASGGLSPPRDLEAHERRPSNMTLEDLRRSSYVNRDVFHDPRSVSSSTAFMTKSVLPTAHSKPAAPLPVQLPPPSGIAQRRLFVGEDQTVEGFLHSLGLGKYAIHFKAEEVDMAALKQMEEIDFKELGVPMGPRKKILLALHPWERQKAKMS